MPELPEVEIVRRGLARQLVGHKVVRVEQRRPDLRFPLPERFAERLRGNTIEALDRRAKYLLVRLSGGEALVMHLGMTGRFSVTPSPRPSREEGWGEGQRLGPAHVAAPHVMSKTCFQHDPLPNEGVGRGDTIGAYVYDTGTDPKHDHVVIHMSNGAAVTYNDPRRFGFMLLVPQTQLEQHPLFAGLGVEPLGNELTAGYIARRALGRRADLKAFLMDQRNLSGLGNIYVSEALFRAGLSPNRRAACLALKSGRPTERAERLVPAIRSVLEDALQAGGSTLRDYRQADGSSGRFQNAHAVYDRAGEPCARPGCRGIVRRSIQGGRSTFYCPSCQR